MKLLQLHKTWWLTLAGFYSISFLWLGSFFVDVPIVIRQAPLGILSLLHPPTNAASARVELGVPGLAIHFGFWLLFLTGAFFCKVLPRSVATAIYLCVIALLILTVAGCAEYYHFAGHTFN